MMSEATNARVPTTCSASHVVIFREVRRDGQIYRKITDIFEPMHKYNIFMQRYKINILYLCVGSERSVIFRGICPS